MTRTPVMTIAETEGNADDTPPQPRRGFGFTRRQIQEKYTCMPRPGGVFPASFPALIERSLCFPLHRIPCARLTPTGRAVKGRKFFFFKDGKMTKKFPYPSSGLSKEENFFFKDGKMAKKIFLTLRADL